MKIFLEWFESGLHNLKDIADRVVIIDALRASATIVTAFESNVKTIIPTHSIEEGLVLKESYKDAVFSAEIDGVKVDVADVGNSPTGLKRLLKKKPCKVLILRTSAGSQLIKKAEKLGFGEIIVGSFLNAYAVAKYLSMKKEDVGIVCAGYNKKFFAIEDFLAAGLIISEINGLLEDDVDLEDQALASFLAFQASKENLYEVILQGRSAKRIIEIGEDEDISASLRVNSSSVVPIVIKGSIVPLRP